MSHVKTRYSKQRETIYEVLKNDPTHPNVDSIYLQVKQMIPDISLGTVYRNLNLLADQKRINRLDIGDGTVHFDACIEPHYHIICDDCGDIKDLYLDNETLDTLITMVQKQCDMKIHETEILFHGTCQHCLKKNS